MTSTSSPLDRLVLAILQEVDSPADAADELHDGLTSRQCLDKHMGRGEREV